MFNPPFIAGEAVNGVVGPYAEAIQHVWAEQKALNRLPFVLLIEDKSDGSGFSTTPWPMADFVSSMTEKLPEHFLASIAQGLEGWLWIMQKRVDGNVMLLHVNPEALVQDRPIEKVTASASS